jgi:hypothetical protein
VVEPDAGVVSAEPVDERLARRERARGAVRRDLAGVEVDRVAHRGVVDQPDHEPVSDASVQSGTRHGAVVGPQLLADTWGDVGLRVGDPERTTVDPCCFHRR